MSMSRKSPGVDIPATHHTMSGAALPFHAVTSARREAAYEGEDTSAEK